ncbi:MAG: DUF3558 family protein [Pseudonocardiaceae bacterium]
MRRGTGRLVVLAVVGLVAGGCGGGGSRTPAPAAVADAAKVDMCTILSNPELTQLGIKPETREPENKLGLVGCGWLGDPFTLRLERDKDTITQYDARRASPAFTYFADNKVNGRAGIQLSVRSDRSDCAQLMDGGSVSLTVAVAQSGMSYGTPFDPCGQALRIAQMIEPRLPKVGT